MRILAAAFAASFTIGVAEISAVVTTETTGLSTSGSKAMVPFPATPTPKPTPVPFTSEQLDEHVISKADLGQSTNSIGLWYNGYRRSQLDPCGCVSKQLGGIDKEAKLVERLEALGIPSVKVEAGGYLRDMPTENDIKRTGFLLKALKKLGYGAFNVGYTDIGPGAARLKSAASEANATLISANISDDGGNLLFKPYVILDGKTKKGDALKVGVIGVTRARIAVNTRPTSGSAGLAAAGGGAATSATGVMFGNQLDALKKYVPELRKSADVVVLLDYDKRDKVQSLLKDLPPEATVDIAVAGEFLQDSPNVIKINGAQLVSGGYEGKHAGFLILDVEDKHIANVRNRYLEVVQNIPSVADYVEIMKQSKATTQPTPAPGAAPVKLNLGL